MTVEKILEDYERIRRHCLRHADIHPDDKSVCHQALRKASWPTPAIAIELAALLDDMALALRAALQAREGWVSVEDVPLPKLCESYLVANKSGQVAPHIRGVIHNNVGTANDWAYGESITHWMPLPAAPAADAQKGSGE